MEGVPKVVLRATKEKAKDGYRVLLHMLRHESVNSLRAVVRAYLNHVCKTHHCSSSRRGLRRGSTRSPGRRGLTPRGWRERPCGALRRAQKPRSPSSRGRQARHKALGQEGRRGEEEGYERGRVRGARRHRRVAGWVEVQRGRRRWVPKVLGPGVRACRLRGVSCPSATGAVAPASGAGRQRLAQGRHQVFVLFGDLIDLNSRTTPSRSQPSGPQRPPHAPPTQCPGCGSLTTRTTSCRVPRPPPACRAKYCGD